MKVKSAPQVCFTKSLLQKKCFGVAGSLHEFLMKFAAFYMYVKLLIKKKFFKMTVSVIPFWKA